MCSPPKHLNNNNNTNNGSPSLNSHTTEYQSTTFRLATNWWNKAGRFTMVADCHPTDI